MRIKLIAAGTKMPSWVTVGFEEYQKRLRQEVTLDLIEVAIAKRSKNSDIKKLNQQEGAALLQQHNTRDYLVALDLKGVQLSTQALAKKLSQWQELGSNVSLLVGGPDGLAPECLQQAQFAWSLSPLTLPHPMVRVILAEQLYRAWSITKSHPYHK